VRGLEAQAREVLDRRLLRDGPCPIAIALSGGGDSLALTLIADAWARDAGRELIVLTVDHGLQAESRAWTDACAATAARLGRPLRALRWEGVKPATGLPAAARAARHRLLADAARAAGARVIVMGHTADDLREAATMRASGATTPDPHEWAPSPAWPEGRGVFLLRPLLTASRAGIRAWLTARGAVWIDDPANTDTRYARSRARLEPSAAPAGRSDPPPLALAGHVTVRAGVITLDRAEFRAASPEVARRFVALASVCAGGGDRRPATARIDRAADALRSAGDFMGTLAGARIEADAAAIRVFREAGEAARGGLAPLPLTPGRPIVWDGRFEIVTDRAGVEVCRLAGLTRRLPGNQQRALRDLPAAARGGLPAVVDPDGNVDSPALTSDAVDLIGDRLRAAAGLIACEPS
jgi:tRNA(Ile)-lysidine synthase